ncbi:helix-turn-helix domain-containing protein [Paenibacillus spongiae]|uniref:Helix-turn-helix domain-containing protein n=1 Tax=Paenibacillus spongiae TaxID=2909671 RepID=A0ABY5S8H1_9BACL|nr:helix-turn-helix domain-containing protein [Paenibacillus spongiae]UVI28830.1 helix-turn-helix domain-containing protein [Paenibacillus spongiae]
MSVKEIAMVSGSYDGAHLSKSFKASETMTPQQYREQDAYLLIQPD